MSISLQSLIGRAKGLASPLFRPEVLPGHIRLDLGCGCARVPGLIGFDRLATAGGAQVLADVTQAVPVKDGCADLVFARDVLEHLPDTVAVVSEWARILKPGGRLMVIVPHAKSRDAMDDPTHCSFFTGGTADYLAGKAMPHYQQSLFRLEMNRVMVSVRPRRAGWILFPLNLLLWWSSRFLWPVLEELVGLPFVVGEVHFSLVRRDA